MDTKLSQITDATLGLDLRGGDVGEETPAEECATKHLLTTVRHFGFTEKYTVSAHAPMLPIGGKDDSMIMRNT